jgi:hypothetical protein
VAAPFALDNAGRSMDARIAIVAITISNSISVKNDLSFVVFPCKTKEAAGLKMLDACILALASWINNPTSFGPFKSSIPFARTPYAEELYMALLISLNIIYDDYFYLSR